MGTKRGGEERAPRVEACGPRQHGGPSAHETQWTTDRTREMRGHAVLARWGQARTEMGPRVLDRGEGWVSREVGAMKGETTRSLTDRTRRGTGAVFHVKR